MVPATAVSRYHQIFRFFMTNNSPNVGDHDFPSAGYLIVPSGYMALTSTELKENICDEYVNDELNDFRKPHWSVMDTFQAELKTFLETLQHEFKL